MLENYWVVDTLVWLVGQDYADVIMSQTWGLKSGADVLVWLSNIDNRFTTSNAWDLLCISTPKGRWPNWIWQAALPKKFFVTMWKALNHFLSVDDRVRHIGIPLVSKCECCKKGAIENLNHVLHGVHMAAKL